MSNGIASGSAPNVTLCPACREPLYWYDAFRCLSCRCPHCKTRLRLQKKSQVLVGFLLAGLVAMLVLVPLVRLGGFATFYLLLGTALIAGLAGGCAYAGYTFAGPRLALLDRKAPDYLAYKVVLALGGIMLGLISGLATGICLFVFAEHTFLKGMAGRNIAQVALGQLFGPEFPSAANATVIGQADSSWTLQSLDGKAIQFGDLQGKAVFLNIWATWCGPCVMELPSIAELKESLKGENVVFVLASNEKPDHVKAFLEKKQMDLPVYIYNPQTLPPIFHTQGIPATFVVNKAGGVVFQRIGSSDWNTEACRQFLRELGKQ